MVLIVNAMRANSGNNKANKASGCYPHSNVQACSDRPWMAGMAEEARRVVPDYVDIATTRQVNIC